MISTISKDHRLERLNALQEKRLVTARTSSGFTIFKYTRKVFYDNLWNVDPFLLEARGLVLDSAGNIIARPFTKVFNHHENGITFPRDETVVVVEKKNGFMAVVSVFKNNDEYEAIVTTSGSLDSEFVTLSKKYLGNSFLQKIASVKYSDRSFMFEICCPEDPHIIEEVNNVYLIGARYTQSEQSYTEKELDELCAQWNFDHITNCVRPAVLLHVSRFSDIVSLAKTVKHEGFMVYNADQSKALKIKSPFYLGKKFLSRSKKVELFWTDPSSIKQTIDEEFYFLLEELPKKNTLAQWQEMDNIARLRLIENMLEENENGK